MNKMNQLSPLMAVFTLPCQGKEAIGECVSQIYTVSLTLVGIVAFVQIVWGGFMLLTAAGNTSKAGQAMDKIRNAVLGIVLLFSSYLILKTINPDLVNFNFTLEKITKKEELATSDSNPNQATRIEDFDVSPRLAGLRGNTPLKFKLRIYGVASKIANLEECYGTNNFPMRYEVYVEKESGAPRLIKAFGEANGAEINKSMFGDGKVLNFDFEQRVTDYSKLSAGDKNVRYFATFSCFKPGFNWRLLNKSASVQINLAP